MSSPRVLPSRDGLIWKALLVLLHPEVLSRFISAAMVSVEPDPSGELTLSTATV